eukprot:1230336-Amphidinium_carterae.2
MPSLSLTMGVPSILCHSPTTELQEAVWHLDGTAERMHSCHHEKLVQKHQPQGPPANVEPPSKRMRRTARA